MQRILAIVFIFILQFQSISSTVFAADSTSFNPVPISVAAKGGIPVGTIIPWASTGYPEDYDSARTNWMDCDGRSFSKATHEELGKLYPSGRIPNLHNQFMRGGTLAQVGQTMADSTRSHYHQQPSHTHTFNGHLVSGAISGTASAQAYTDMWTEIGYGGFPLKEGDLSELGHRVRDSSNRYTSGGSISGSVANTSVAGSLSLSGGDNTYQNTNSDGSTGGAETAPQHIRVRYLIRTLP